MNKSNLVVVAGGTGAIGNAIADQLSQIGFSDIIKFGTKTSPAIDFNDENSILESVEYIQKKNKPISVFFDATGILHHNNSMPEKTFKNIEFEFAKKNFLIKHFVPLLDKEEKSVFASLSAKVGSISDNGYGGWYSYRASKAALNQLIKTASIEMKVKNKKAVIVALHPGTVKSSLSKPFQKTNLKIQNPEESAKYLIKIINSIDQSQTGKFFNWDGYEIAW